jgi:DNA-binding transcriptional regulator YiaG
LIFKWRRKAKKMSEHADERSKGTRVQNKKHKGAHLGLVTNDQDERVENEVILPVYDATTFVGLKTIVHNAAIQREEDGETTIELPKMPELLASAAMVRCLIPVRLRGYELRAMRKIMKLTLAELAKRLDEKTAVETVSRWESEAQPMGGYAEKLFRLIVCEQVRENAPGIDYTANMISNMIVRDPWRNDPNCEAPEVRLWLIPLKELSGAIIEAWNEKKVA